MPIPGAKQIVYAIAASARFNSEIAVSLQNIIQMKRLELLPSFDAAADDLRTVVPDYFNTTDAELQAYYERPYFETSALINEMLGLEYDISPQTHLINVHEIGKATKDRYTSIAYGNIFAEELERDLLLNSGGYNCGVYIN